MPIRVACRCGQQFDAPDVMAGTFAPCPVCQSPIAIPRVQPTPQYPVPQYPTTQPHAVQQPPQPTAPIVVSCSCGQLFAATIDMIGMEANCPRCGQLIVVPPPQYGPVPTYGTSAPPNLDSLGIDARTPGPFDKTLTAARDTSAWERTAATPQPNAARGAHAHTTKSIADSLMGQARQEMSDRNAGIPEPNYGLMIAGAGIALIGLGILVGASIAHSDAGSIIGTCKLFGGIGVFARGYSAKRYDG